MTRLPDRLTGPRFVQIEAVAWGKGMSKRAFACPVEAVPGGGCRVGGVPGGRRAGWEACRVGAVPGGALPGGAVAPTCSAATRRTPAAYWAGPVTLTVSAPADMNESPRLNRRNILRISCAHPPQDASLSHNRRIRLRSLDPGGGRHGSRTHQPRTGCDRSAHDHVGGDRAGAADGRPGRHRGER